MNGMHIYNYKYIVNFNDKIAKFDCTFNGANSYENGMVRLHVSDNFEASRTHFPRTLFIIWIMHHDSFYWEWFNHLNINNSLTAEEIYNAFISSHKN